MDNKKEVYRKALKLFQAKGIQSLSLDEIINELELTPTSYKAYFADKESLVEHIVRQDIEDQKVRQQEINKKAKNAAHEILMLIQDGMKSMEGLNPAYITDMVENYPTAMAIGMENLYNHSYNYTYNILNNGVREGVFRKDINLEIVTKIILENVKLLINKDVFPPERYDIREVYRCIYLYYIRGLCTDDSLRLTEQYFTDVM
jgi:AcrR family transcriptional regulator